MKKKLALLMALMLLLPAMPALTQTGLSALFGFALRDTRLDLAFDNDALTLVEAPWPAITPDDFDFPDAMWQTFGIEKPADLRAQATALLAGCSEIIVWSISPDGNSAILTLNGAFVGYYEGKYRILYPSQTRGVEDLHQNLAEYSKLSCRVLFDEEEVVYSNDGRYAAVYNIRSSLMNLKTMFDPIIIDLSTGEMVLTATYANKPFKENFGTVTTACFSADGQYFYYILFGNTTESRSALYRYDLTAETTELCCAIPSHPAPTCYPRLRETADGSLIVLMRNDSRNDKDSGILRIRSVNGQWQVTKRSFTLPAKSQYVTHMDYSVNTGYALMSPIDMNPFLFMAIRPEDDFSGLNRYLAIRKDDNTVDALTQDEVNAVLAEVTYTKDGKDYTNTKLMPYHWIVKATLSPDGHYALILTSHYDNSPDSTRLFLVRLEDLACRKVAGINPASIPAAIILAYYRPLIEWQSDRLLIATKNSVQLFRFQ